MPEPIPFAKVFDDELRAIATRRRFHEQQTVSSGPPDNRATEGRTPGAAAEHTEKTTEKTNAERPRAKDLVGLALSGGGVRSASFNLGIVQALDQHGFLAQVDYLSTVSGGGYLGGYLSSLSLDARHDDPQHDSDRASTSEPSLAARQAAVDQRARNGSDAATGHSSGRQVTSLAPQPRSPQPKRVRKLIYSGDYLRSRFSFLNRYLMGLLIINVFAFSGVLAAGAGIAWLFRWFDQTDPRYVLQALGFGDDVGRAFFPSYVAGFIWLAVWGLSYGRAGRGAWSLVARGCLVLFIASTLAGLATLLGNGSINFKRVAEILQVNIEQSTVDSLRNWLMVVVVTPILLFLLPYFRPAQLIKSGITPSSKWWEREIFKFAGLALVAGVPLLVVGFFARENISNIDTTRDGTLARTDVDWIPFWRQVRAEANEHEANDPLAGAATKPTPETGPLLGAVLWDERTKAQIDEIERIESECDRIEEKLTFKQRWFSFGGYLLAKVTGEPVTENKFVKLFKWRRTAHFQKTEAMENVNVALIKHELWKSVQRSVASAESRKQFSVDQKNQVLARVLEAKVVAAAKPIDANPTIAGSAAAHVKWKKDVTNANRLMLVAYFGDKIVVPKTAPPRLSVVIDKDQPYRLQCLRWSLLVFVVAGFIVNLNATSLHGYYREQLADTWLEDCAGFHRDIPLARVDTTSRGYPYHLICATANYIRRESREEASAGHFLFSRLYCGSSRLGYESTETYSGGTFDLASAMAISAAAVSPARMTNLLSVVLLFLLNFRLGQWLPNPGSKPWIGRWLPQYVARWPAPFFVLASMLRRSETRAYCFITDGGHYENLGAGPLLRRGCRLIICCDAGHDPDYKFADFVALQRQQRLDNGIEICALDEGVLSFDVLFPDKQQRLSKTHYVVARVHYPLVDRSGKAITNFGPEGGVGYLIYLKPTFSGKEDLELVTEMRSDSEFPHDSTADQFYPPEKFESYRRLGYHIGKILTQEVFGQARLTEWSPTVPIPPSCTEATPLNSLVKLAERVVSRLETTEPKLIANKPIHARGKQNQLAQAIQQHFIAEMNGRENVAELLEDALNNALTRPLVVNMLIDVAAQPTYDEKLRQTAMVFLKIFHHDETERVRKMARKITTSPVESNAIRESAGDLLAALEKDKEKNGHGALRSPQKSNPI